MIESVKFPNEIEITSDSPYSGKLCFAAKTWWEEKKNQETEISFPALFVNSATHSDKKGIWGKYRKLRNDIKKEGMTDDE